MCGISGVLAYRGLLPTQNELQAMIGAVAHRGPDGFGYYCNDKIGLAHARLSIIDLAGGGQPIHNEDKTVWVVFNGEIFNYRELRTQLEQNGHRFYTHSDTEVIVHLYEQYGEQFVDHLNGQFAIALWDSPRQRLVLARDRVGIRPLFYTEYDGRLAFASEIKSLFANPSIPRQFDLTSLGQVFTYWATIAPRTVFENVWQLLPGQMLIVENGQKRFKTFWDWSFPEPPFKDINPAQAAQEVRELLIDAVRLQLRADVPVGAYLSGGLDSSILTAIIKNYTDTPLRTFSIAFEDNEFDESGFQQELVKFLGTHHSSFRCSKRDIADAFPRAVWYSETPLLRTAPTPLMLLSERVRAEGYKVVLTGEGADEVYGGYDIYKEAKIRRFWAQSPHSTWRPRLLEKLYPYLKHSPVAAASFTQNFFAQNKSSPLSAAYAHQPRWSTTRRLWQFFKPELREQLLGDENYQAIDATLPSAFSSWAGLNRDQYIEAHTFMSGYLLSSQGDRMAMANSIEGRFPFLDHRVIEHACRLPPKLKIRGLTEKYILREAMRDLLPASIYQRTKQPYRAPDCQSFFDNGQACEYVADLFNERLANSPYFDAQAVSKLYDKCRLGRAIGFADNMAFVGILSTLLLDDMFIQKSPSRFITTQSTNGQRLLA